ncbi:DUF4156 domain-containing protein [Shewanella sp. 1_MG-2023]|uniref:DUF4156 domain-containing protein n=1 Tax=unclassified Shewanella TaxID=196818 RepID=UPI000C85174F|nr:MULTISPECIES: DUF4156 domain-containing protein [unclassified Shewanella]MDO6610758.1 DUF4156 domain-containing protein [Shewanella sp. 7_MG-2023]MDO6770882.1 DUF4156 domain-containing protein [Shewanella sp. 2_MG-2023]MDO6793099.1 DUF4156 domain-containing protein [Shewanella sp. 1_MG-2023]PMG76022.1 hypothetical protein BCU84_01755 [Shewanella sp. 10N.286.51.B7]
MNTLKVLLISLSILSLTGCITTPEMNSEHVAVLWSEQGDMDICELKGTLIGSQGHWYDYLFITNKDLTQGAINQLRNDALTLGANTVFLYKPKVFTTSVTLLANAYTCPANVT